MYVKCVVYLNKNCNKTKKSIYIGKCMPLSTGKLLNMINKYKKNFTNIQKLTMKC